MKFLIIKKSKKINSVIKWLIEAMERKNIEYRLINPHFCKTIFYPDRIEVYYEGELISNADLMLVRRTRGMEKEVYELAKTMEKIGIAIIDDPSSLLYSSSKFYAQIFRVNRVPFPVSLFAEKINANTLVAIKKAGLIFPLIIKPQNGSRGQGVELLENEAEIIAYGKKYPDLSFIIQAKIDIKEEFRVITIGGRSLGACLKKTDELVKNAALGSCFEYCRDEEIENLAEKVANCHFGDIFGVDVARDQAGKLWVIECNRNPNFTAFRQASGIKIEDKIIDYCLSKIKK